MLKSKFCVERGVGKMRALNTNSKSNARILLCVLNFVVVYLKALVFRILWIVVDSNT